MEFVLFVYVGDSFITIRKKMLHKSQCCNVLLIHHNAVKEETAFHLSRTKDNLIHTLIAISLVTILILSRDCVMIVGASISNRIYCTPTHKW
jgi:hypothetical protein